MARKRPTIKHGRVYRYNLLGYDLVAFTEHALERMRGRKVTRQQIYDTIDSPDETGLRADPGNLRVRKVIGREVVDVVYNLLRDRVRIVSAWKNPVGAPKGVAPRILRSKRRPKKVDKRKKKR